MQCAATQTPVENGAPDKTRLPMGALAWPLLPIKFTFHAIAIAVVRNLVAIATLFHPASVCVCLFACVCVCVSFFLLCSYFHHSLTVRSLNDPFLHTTPVEFVYRYMLHIELHTLLSLK